MAGALVHLLLPDHVVGLLGARLRGAVLEAFQDDSGVSASALAYTGVEGGGAAIAHLGALQQLVATRVGEDVALALQHGGLAREFEGAVGGGVTAYPDAEEVANAPAGFGVALGRLNFLVIDRKVVDGVTDLQIQIAAGAELGAVGVQVVACLDLDVLRSHRDRLVEQVFVVVVVHPGGGFAEEQETASVAATAVGFMQARFLSRFKVDVPQGLQTGFACVGMNVGGAQDQVAAHGPNVDPRGSVDGAAPQVALILIPAPAGLVVDGVVGIFARNGGVAARLDVDAAIALGIHAVHGNVACGPHVHARSADQLRIVPVVVGKACCCLCHLQCFGIDVARGGRDVQRPTGLQATALQIDVVTHQVEVALDVQPHIVGAAHTVAACAAREVDVAIARGQCQVAVHANLAPGQSAPACGGGVDRDIALPLHDGQVGGAHQDRVGIQAQCAARFNAGLATDGAQARCAGAHRLHSGAVQGQVASFVEDCGRATAVEAAGVGLCALAGQAQNVFGNQVGTRAVDLARGAGAG